MKKKTSIVGAGMWQLGNVLLFSSTQLIFYGYFARVLPKSDFGLIAIANVFVSLASTLTESGMGASLIYKQDAKTAHNTAAFVSNVVIGLFFWGIIYCLSGTVAAFYHTATLEPLLKLMSFNFVIQSFGSVSNYLLQKNMKFKVIFLVEVSSNLISSVAGIFLSVYFNLGLWALAYSILLMTLLNAVGYSLFNKEKVIVFKGITKSTFKDLFSFGAGLTLVKMSNFFTTNGVNFFIGKMVSLSTLGIFERIFKIMIMPARYLGNVLDKVMFPGMARLQDDDKLYEYYKKSLLVVNSVMLPVTLLLILYSKEIVYLLLGGNWLSAITPLRVLFLCLLFRVSVRMCDSVVRAKGLVYKSARNKFMNALFLLVLVYAGHFNGILGICIAFIVFSISNYLSQARLVQVAFRKKMSDTFIVFLPPLKYAVFAACISAPVYYSIGYFFQSLYLPVLASVSLLGLVIIVIWRKMPELIDDNLLLLIDKIKAKRSNKE